MVVGKTPHLLDLFHLEEIQALQDAFCKATGVASLITEADGRPITRPSNFCRLCRDFIRTTPKGQANCFRSDALIGTQKLDGPTVCPCFSGGLWDAGASITLEGKHIANWLIGQVRDPSMTTESMMSYARDIGADETEYRKALEEVQVMDKDSFQKISSFLFLMANELSGKAWKNYKLMEAGAALEEANRTLEEKVALRTSELARANEDLLGANVALRREMAEREEAQRRLVRSERIASLGRLVAGLAHEINTPLGVAITASSWLQSRMDRLQSEGLFREVPDQAGPIKESLDITRRNLNRVVELVQGFRQLSADHLDDTRRIFDLRDLAEVIAAGVTARIPGAAARLEIRIAAGLRVDSWPGDFYIILSNLVGNAFQHAGDDARVILDAAVEDQGLEMRVTDTGKGIPDSIVEHPFEPYAPVDRSEGSKGLGLFMVHNTVTNRLGGQVSLSSPRRQGTEVILTVPNCIH